MKNLFIGIDFSKQTIDVSFVERGRLKEFTHNQFANDKDGFKQMLSWLKQQTQIPRKEWMFCGEHTGLHSLALSEFLTSKGMFIWIDSPLQIKLSMGIQRTKNDKVDSEQLALYAYRFEDKAKAYVPMSKANKSLQLLYAFRGRLIKAKVALSQAATEMRAVIRRDPTSRYIYEQTQQEVERLAKLIEGVEKKMLTCIKEDPSIDENYKLLTSIKGIAFVNACVMIIYTGNFTQFESPRQFACYTGMAPFGKSSGTSKKATPKVSQIANKEIKALLTQAAKAAIRHNHEIREYFNRKKAEGKQDWLIVNNVRNKLIHRAFAVVKRKEPYVENFLGQY
ncbi:IS110 family transposase [Parabacteroides sp. PF5-9]|uniref:IS110 family transposase n=1 Tax=Parabacteroides sp. PF5-9 TaxID=1742404 RepID=UPI002476556E|nr:IS110 family transposase [Parabacteroides sp. PF5-9]MDH6356366.1 transposase [Parabacteroides sp. PF5-9]